LARERVTLTFAGDRPRARGLGDGEPIAGAQQQAGALGRRQPGEGGLDGLARGALGRQVGAGGGPALLVVGREGQPGQAAAMAQRVEGRVGRDAVEPGGQHEVGRAR